LHSNEALISESIFKFSIIEFLDGILHVVLVAELHGSSPIAIDVREHYLAGCPHMVLEILPAS
jgi:hypothetical protein